MDPSIASKPRTYTRSLQPALLVAVLVALALVILGRILFPAASLLGVAGDCLILILYGVVISLGLPRLHPQVMHWAGIFGLAAGAVFAAEILLEYVFLPKDNTNWGLAEFGLAFLLYLLCGFWTAHRTRSLRSGVLASLLAAMLSSLIWTITVLAVFYIFRGSARQAQVLLAEGNYQDFVRSGMASFDTFVMEDFYGAVFFHSLLMPLAAAILGALGALAGRWLRVGRQPS